MKRALNPKALESAPLKRQISPVTSPAQALQTDHFMAVPVIIPSSISSPTTRQTLVTPCAAGMSTFSTRGGLYERAQKRFAVQDGKKLFTYAFFEKRRLDAMVRQCLVLFYCNFQFVCSSVRQTLNVAIRMIS